MTVELPEKADVAIACKVINLSPGLSNSERRVAGAIIDHFNRRTGRCDPSVQRLSKLLGMNRATVMRATAKLTSNGCNMFSKRSHGGHFNCASYQPNWKRFRDLVREWDMSMKGVGNSSVESRPRELRNVAIGSTRKLHNCCLIGRNGATQTHSNNPLEKPIEKEIGEVELEANGHSQAIKVDQLKNAQVVKPVPKRRLIPETKLRQPSHAVAAIEAAKGRIDRAFYEMGFHIYEKFVELVSPELLEMAASEEMIIKGTGIRFIHAALRNEGEGCRGV